MAEDFESWDSDPDFLIPSSGLSLPLSSSNSPSSHSSPLPSQEDSTDFFSLLDSKLHEPDTEGRDRKEDSLDSLRSTTSTESTVSTTGTIKGLMEGLSLDREDGEATFSFEPEVRDEQVVEKPKSKMQTLRLGSDLSKLLVTTVAGSGRGKVIHLGSTPFGKAVDVGEGDWDQDLDFDEFEGEGDKLGSRGGEEDERRRIMKKASWTSHISLDDEFEETPQLSLKDNEEKPALKQKISIDSFKDDPESEEISDLDFDLPSTQATFEISPSLSLNRPSMSSLRSHTTSDSQHPPRESSTDSISSVKTTALSSIRAPPPLSLATASSRLSVISVNSTSASATTDDDDSDAEFFQDLELPSYFLGGSSNESNSSPNDRQRGGGATTPPTSEGEMDAFFSENSPSPKKEEGKIDLQSLLKRKLELRGGRGLLFGGVNSTSPTKEQLEGLEKHRERDEEEQEAGKELSLSQSREKEKDEVEESWNAEEMRERMRTISGARAKEAQMARNSRSGLAGRANGGMRRTVSMGGGKLPILPTGANKRPSIVKRSDTTPEITRGVGATRTGLSRSGSSAGVTQLSSSSSRSSLPQLARPTSAQSSDSTSTTGSHSTRKGPPPAPSTASRDRVRMRTISLRTVGSTSDLRNAPTSSNLIRRPSRLNLDQTSDNRSLSPVPVTPVQTPSHPPRAASSPGPTPSLRPKRSQQHLRPSLAPSGTRTIERKRSLQNLSSTDQQVPPSSASRPTSRQNSLRSPSPAHSHHTPSNRPSFAAPTASSASRVRERVNSNPHPLHPSIVPASPNPSISSARSSSNIARLLQPTLSSASKTRSSTKPTPIKSHPPLSGVRIPSHSLTLARPASSNRKRSQDDAYGDGTELDGFDDLPVSKEREKALLVTAKGRSASRASTVESKKSGAGSVGSSLAREGKGAGKVVKSLLPTMSKGLKGRKEGENAKEKDKEKEKGKKKRREPHLIRHLGGAQGVPKGELAL